MIEAKNESNRDLISFLSEDAVDTSAPVSLTSTNVSDKASP